MKVLVSHLIEQNCIDPQHRDRVVLQYNKSFLQNEVKLHHKKINSFEINIKLHHENFNSFERSKDHLDEFVSSTFEVHKYYEELSSVIKIILVLSDGKSAVERSFSLGKSFIVENILE